MSQALSPNTIKRLAFIRFLHSQGLEQAARPQPLAATALLSFHDAVEMFLLLAAEHLGVNLNSNTTFDGYWTQIADQTARQLPSRPAMRRMNKSRVNFKHHGSIPSATDLDQFRGDVTTFFTDATRDVFDADFASIDMTALVTQQAALTGIRNAEIRARHGDYVEALASLSKAMDDLLDDYASRKRTGLGTTAFTFGLKDVGEALVDVMKTDPQFGSHIVALTMAVEAMQQATRVLAMGLDYRRYVRFDMLTPPVLVPGAAAAFRYGRCLGGRCPVRSATRNTSSASCS